MTESFDDQQQPGVMDQIREGMDVYDSMGDKVGTVHTIHYDASDKGASYPGEVSDDDRSLKDTFVDAITPDDLPDPRASYLYQNGYLRVDGSGLFDSDHYVLAQEIANVSDGRVTLAVSRDELPKA